MRAVLFQERCLAEAFSGQRFEFLTRVVVEPSAFRCAVGRRLLPVLFVGFCVLVMSSALAHAQVEGHATVYIGSEQAYEGYTEVIHSLTLEGFTVTQLDWTMLKRLRIRSRRGDEIRETIISPSTGRIIWDSIWQE